MSKRARRVLFVGIQLAAACGVWSCAEDATKPAPSTGHALSGVVRLTWLETGEIDRTYEIEQKPPEDTKRPPPKKKE